jgi:hypothetical protein
VTGAVAHGLQTGGGGGQAATGAGRRSQLQQQQPAGLTQRVRIAKTSDVLFMIVSPYFEDHPLIQLRRAPTGSSLLPVRARSWQNWHSTIAHSQRSANQTGEKIQFLSSAHSGCSGYANYDAPTSFQMVPGAWGSAPVQYWRIATSLEPRDSALSNPKRAARLPKRANYPASG